MSALDERIDEYLLLYGDVKSAIWVLYSDLVIATHREGADEALLELLRDRDVLHGLIHAVRRRAQKSRRLQIERAGDTRQSV